MSSPDKQCDMAGFIALRILIGVSKPKNPNSPILIMYSTLYQNIFVHLYIMSL